MFTSLRVLKIDQIRVEFIQTDRHLIYFFNFPYILEEMSGLFAIVVSGRLVQTDFQQVDINKWLITIPNVDSINHIVVFMTGTQPLQPGRF